MEEKYNSRSFLAILKGIGIRFLSIFVMFTFPAQFTVFIHQLRGVKIGKGSKINRTVIIDDSRPDLVEIGEKVWVTAGVQILCHQRDISKYDKTKAVMELPLVYKKVIIKDGAHIGIGAILMPGVTIGKGAVIGAGAVVTSDIPDFSVAVGIPAKVIKTFN
jgi:acetyltransferase-like isoleucine patch superfamily enzyme